MSEQRPTPKQRAELERIGPDRVTLILVNYPTRPIGAESLIGGFECGDIKRALIDAWLGEKLAQKKTQEKADRIWLRIASSAAIVGAIVGIAGLLASSICPR
jgi:hypothetical protein